MRFARKLAYALWLGIVVVYGINGWTRYQREADLFETDIRRDHEVMGRGLVAAVAEVWEDEGQARALDIVGRANAREGAILIRWVDPRPGAAPEHVPTAPLAALATVSAGEIASWTEEAGPGRLVTYVPLGVNGRWLGAIELSEALTAERDYLRASLWRMLLTFGSLALMSGLVAMVLGARFVGRPIRLLVEKARRVGAGDFEGALDLRQDDELGELATEMNAMSRRLAEARDRVEAASRGRSHAVDQLRHAERLTTVGKLASGVAHELGTPLNVIGVRAGMIAQGEVDGPAARESARVVLEQVDRITRIVRQLLDFARRGTPDRAVDDVGAVAARSVALVEPLARKAGVHIVTRWTERPLNANIDPVQMQQVFANLLVNGVQAMPGGGVLEVSVARAEGEEPADVGGGPRRCVVVEVSDEGTGMDDATLARVFDPFFTTKGVGEGTGLGLSVAYGIVREHGGWLTARSRPGQGATFAVWLPEDAR